MKKVVSLLIVAVMVLTCAVAINATEEKDVLAAAKAAMTQGLYNSYYVQIENTLNQVELTSDQCDQLIAIIDDLKSTVTLDRESIPEYTEEERQYGLKKLQEAAAVIGATVTVENYNLDEYNNSKIIVTLNAGGKDVPVVGPDTPKTTNVSSESIFANVAPFVAIALIALAGSAVVVAKKRSA